MALAMAVMPWNWGRILSEVPLTAFFAAAATWFSLTAVSCRQESRLAATARRLPYGVGMAAMAWMAYSTAGPSHEILVGGLPAAHQAAHLSHPPGESKVGGVVTGVLALHLLVCALRSLTRDMPALGRASEAVAATGIRSIFGRTMQRSRCGRRTAATLSPFPHCCPTKRLWVLLAREHTASAEEREDRSAELCGPFDMREVSRVLEDRQLGCGHGLVQ